MYIHDFLLLCELKILEIFKTKLHSRGVFYAGIYLVVKFLL